MPAERVQPLEGGGLLGELAHRDVAADVHPAQQGQVGGEGRGPDHQRPDEGTAGVRIAAQERGEGHDACTADEDEARADLPARAGDGEKGEQREGRRADLAAEVGEEAMTRASDHMRENCCEGESTLRSTPNWAPTNPDRTTRSPARAGTHVTVDSLRAHATASALTAIRATRGRVWVSTWNGGAELMASIDPDQA